MSDSLNERLNKILPRVISDEFLSGSGIGNEIAFHIFDYPPEEEVRVRDFLRTLLDHIPKQKHGLRVKHVNLFDFVLDYLTGRKLLDKVIQTQRDKGDETVKRWLLGPLNVERADPLLPGRSARPARPDDRVRCGERVPPAQDHTLLTNFQNVMGQTPLVVLLESTTK